MNIAELIRARNREDAVRSRLKSVETWDFREINDKIVFLGMYKNVEKLDKEIRGLGLKITYFLNETVESHQGFNLRTVELEPHIKTDVAYTGYTGNNNIDTFLLALAYVTCENKINPERIETLAQPLLTKADISAENIQKYAEEYSHIVTGRLAGDIAKYKLKIFAATATILPKELSHYKDFEISPIKKASDPVFNYLGTHQD